MAMPISWLMTPICPDLADPDFSLCAPLSTVRLSRLDRGQPRFGIWVNSRPAATHTHEINVSLLVPRRPAHWIEPPSGKGILVLAALLDDEQEALMPIDEKHPCFLRWREAVQKYTKLANAGR